MAQFIYFRQSDEVVPQGAPLPVDDDSEGWWAGTQLSFIAVPIATSLATVLLAASLAFGYQQQTEEIVPQPVNEEELWQRPYSIPQTVQLSGPEWDDQIPAGSLFGQPDEDLWAVYTPPYAPPRFLYLPDPEEIPAGFPVGPPDEDYWAVYTPPEMPKRFLYLPDPEELPAGSLYGVPEEEPWVPTVHLVKAVVPVPWVGDEDFIVAAAPLNIEEDYWWTGYALRGSLWVPIWVVDDEIVPPPPPTEGALDAGAWSMQRLPSGRRTITVY